MTARKFLLITDDLVLHEFVESYLTQANVTCEILRSGDRSEERRIAPSAIIACRNADIIAIDPVGSRFAPQIVLPRLRALLPGKIFMLLRPSEDLKTLCGGLGIDSRNIVDDPGDRQSLLAAVAQAKPPTGTAPSAGPADEPEDDTVHQLSAEPAAKEAGVDFGVLAANRVITVASMKGGSGKSTIAMHIITSLMKAGVGVASLDLDHPQETLSRFLKHRAKRRRDNNPDLHMSYHHAIPAADEKPQQVEAMIEKALREWDCVVVDTPAGFSQGTKAALFWTNILITPMNDSFVDLDVIGSYDVEMPNTATLGPFGRMVREAREAKARLKDRDRRIDWVIVRNRLSQLKSRDKEQLADTLARLGEELGFRQTAGLSERVIYRELFRKGLTLADLRDGDTGVAWSLSHVAARQELRQLTAALDVDKIKAEARVQMAS